MRDLLDHLRVLAERLFVRSVEVFSHAVGGFPETLEDADHLDGKCALRYFKR